MIVNTAYDIQANLLAGNSNYTPNYIFVEFSNVANIGDNISLPEVSEDDTIDYYYNLGSGIDYLEIPITLKPYTAEPTGDSKAEVYYSVVTSGMTNGVKGLPFSASNHSTICGLGLVTRLDPNGTKDILFARTVLPDDKQLLKTTGDMYINWKVALK